MAEQWYYRFLDQEMGPVDLSTLRTLAADGAIAHADEVRCGADGDWSPAESIEGLFPKAAEAGDLLGMLSTEDAAPAVSSSPRARGTNCYCRLHDVEIGPLSYEQIAAMAAAGRLTPQDQVRLETKAEWIEAGSIVGLFAADETKSDASAAADEPNLDLNVLLDSKELELAPPGATSVPDDGTRVWYCKVLGHEMGPSTFEEVHAMIADGQLSRTDLLRHGRRGDWVPADSIVGLFPEAETPVGEFEPEADATESDADEDDGYKFDFADFVGDTAAAKSNRPQSRKHKSRKGRGTPGRTDPERSRPAAPREVRPAQTNRPAVEAAAIDRPTPATQPPSLPRAPRPITTAPAPYSPPAAVRTSMPAVPSARPVPVAAPKQRRALGNPFAGVGSAVAGLFRSVGGLFGSLGGGGGLGQNWKPMVAAVVLAAVAYLIYFGSPFSSSRAPEIYDETLAIWEEANRLKESSGEWSGFKAKTMPRVEQLKKELTEEASSKDRLMQLMLYCHRDCLPQILQSPDPKSSKWTEMNDYMAEAKRLAPPR
jgi:hypothetical protein